MKLTLRENLVLTLTVVVLIAGYVFVFAPASDQRRMLRADVTLKRRALTDIDVAILNAEQLDRRAAQTRREIADFTQTLPKAEPSSLVTARLSQESRNYHLTVGQIDGGSSAHSAIYTLLPVHLRLSGDCSDLYCFLQHLETNPQPIHIGQMVLHRAEQDGEVTADLSVDSYFAPGIGTKADQTASVH